MESKKTTFFLKISVFVLILVSIPFAMSIYSPTRACRIWHSPKCEQIVDKMQALSLFGVSMLCLILVLMSKKSSTDFRLIKESTAGLNSPLRKYKKSLVILLLLLISLLIVTVSVSTTYTYCLSSASSCPLWGKAIVVVLLLISVLMSQLIWALYWLYRYSYHNYYKKRFGYKKLQDTPTFYIMWIVLLVAGDLSLVVNLLFMLFFK